MSNATCAQPPPCVLSRFCTRFGHDEPAVLRGLDTLRLHDAEARYQLGLRLLAEVRVKYRQDRERNDAPMLVELTTKCQRLAAELRRLQAEVNRQKRQLAEVEESIADAVAEAFKAAAEEVADG